MPKIGNAPGQAGESVAWLVRFTFEACEPNGASMHKFEAERYAIYLRNSEDEEAFILKYEGTALLYYFDRAKDNSYEYRVIADDVPLPEKESDVEWLRVLGMSHGDIEAYVFTSYFIPVVSQRKRDLLKLLTKFEESNYEDLAVYFK